MDSGLLTKVLAHWQSAVGPLPIVTPVSSTGFSGAQLWKVTASGNAGPSAWLLRRWPAGGPDAERLDWIHAAVRSVAARTEVALPVPLFRDCDAASLLIEDGVCWELTPWLAGSSWSPVAQPELWSPVLEAVSRVLLAWREDVEPGTGDGFATVGPSHVLRERSKQLEALREVLLRLEAGLPAEDARLEIGLVHQALVAMRQAARFWTRQAALLPRGPFRLQPVPTDLWHDNILVRDQTVTGLVDFGSLQPELPAIALARLAGSVWLAHHARPSPAPSDSTASTVSTACVEPDPAFPLRGPDWHQILQGCGDLVEQDGTLQPGLLEFFHQSTLILGCRNWLWWLFVQDRQFRDPQRAWERAEAMLRGVILSRL